jgi:hypothetical protein
VFTPKLKCHKVSLSASSPAIRTAKANTSDDFYDLIKSKMLSTSSALDNRRKLTYFDEALTEETFCPVLTLDDDLFISFIVTKRAKWKEKRSGKDDYRGRAQRNFQRLKCAMSSSDSSANSKGIEILINVLKSFFN